MRTMLLPDARRYAAMTAAELRAAFLVENLFSNGALSCVWCEADRAVIGTAVPVSKPLALDAPAEMRSTFFCERRELGVLNIGNSGSVAVDGKTYRMDNLDCLYIGMGCKGISFSSQSSETPSRFYLLSYPAHSRHPAALARKAEAQAVRLGNAATCNSRTIYKYIHPDGIKSCQLVMGFTQLDSGSVWNTMPPHTHLRRSEAYLYFNLPADARVFHLMGRPDETRHLVIGDQQVVISPAWSIHAGTGTAAYAFCWGMGGENQAFNDMDALAVGDLR
ncbi:MAG: 5-dehydro-4-deoxy-D-glucuronate isomerase [Phycisphaerae bacterium]